MTIKTNSDLRRQYHHETDRESIRSISNCDGETHIEFSEGYVLWLENRNIAVERAWSGWSREKLVKSNVT